MKINDNNGSHSYRGIFYYDSNVTYEIDDYVLNSQSDSYIYKCIKESKGNLITNKEYFVPYPEHLNDSNEFFSNVPKYSNMYITKDVLQEILNKVRFGNSNGVIIGEIKYTPDPDKCISYSIDGFIEEEGIYTYDALDRIMNESDLNNGYLVVSSNLPEIKNLILYGVSNNLILKQYTYVTNSKRCRVQELLDTFTGNMYLRSSEGESEDNVWKYTSLTDWVSVYRGNQGIQEYISNIESYYTSRLQEYQNKINNYDSLFCFKEISNIDGTTNTVTFNKVNSDVIYVIINYLNTTDYDEDVIISYSCVVDDLASNEYGINGTNVVLSVVLTSTTVTISTDNSAYKIVSIYYKGKYTEQTPQPAMTVTIGSLTNITQDSFDCTFSVSKSVALKGICYGKSSGVTINNGDVIFDTTTNLSVSLTANSLESGTLYYVKAFAVDNGTIIYSSEQSTTTLSSIPIISLISVGSDGLCSYSLLSIGGSSISSYGIKYITESGGDPTNNPSAIDIPISSTLSVGTTNTYQVTGLTNGTTYVFVMYAQNSAGIGWSNTVSQKIVIAQEPGIRLGNETSSGNSIKFTCMLSLNGNTIDSVVIEESVDNNTWSSVETITTSITSNMVISITSLNYNTLYYFRAKAVYNSTYKYSNTISKETDELPLVVTTNPATDVNTNYAYLNGSYTGVNVTEVGFVYSNNRSYIELSNPMANENVITVKCKNTNTPFGRNTIQDLEAGKIYYYKAFATKNEKAVYGSLKNFITSQAVAPLVEKGSILNKGDNSATIGNSEIVNENGSTISSYGIVYIKEADLPSSGNFDLTTPGAYNNTVVVTLGSKVNSSFTLTINNLATNTRYYYRSFAANSEGTGYSTIQTFVS